MSRSPHDLPRPEAHLPNLGLGARERRDVILAAARGVLGKRGYAAATISEIVARAGVAQGTFYLYFPSKGSLLEALSEQMFMALTRSVTLATEGATDLEAAVRAVVRAAFAEASEWTDVRAILNSPGAASELRAGRERLTAPFAQFFSAFLRSRQSAGQAQASLDPDLTGPLLAAFVGQSICHMTSGDGPTPAQIDEIARIVQRAIAPV